MELIEEYYIWFIVGGIILFMTLIGYIADKSNYLEKQKNKNKEKKNKVIEQKEKHLTKKGEQFIRNIGDGRNLVLEESDINYPIYFDTEKEVEPKEEKIESEEKDLSKIGISSLMEVEPKKEENNDINTPLENGVLNLDAYDKENKEEDIWQF